MTGLVILQILRYANLRSLPIKQSPEAIQIEILGAKNEAIERSRNGRNDPSLISVQVLYRIVKDKTKPEGQHRVEQHKRCILCADTCYHCTSK